MAHVYTTAVVLFLCFATNTIQTAKRSLQEMLFQASLTIVVLNLFLTRVVGNASLAATRSHHPRTRKLQGSINGAAALRKLILQDYDKFSFPFEKHWAQDGNRTGLPIELTINFHRVFAVEVTESTADLVVWVRSVWKDPRLVWNPSEYNNITTMRFWVSGGIGTGETSEIWTPDLHLWNAADPLASTLADAHAIVSSDGTVFWARPGHLKPACRFEGLHQFPFDTLLCTLEIGSWGYSGLYLRPIKLDEGFSIGGSQTAGEAFAEFTLDSVESEEYVYPPFIGSPDEDWPVVLYHVALGRAWQPYARGYLLLQILLNLVGFCTFWLPAHSGERMGISITALLASVASELVVAARIPNFGQVSWFSGFSLASLLFTAVALGENCSVIYYHYHTGSTITPRIVTWTRRKLGMIKNAEDSTRKTSKTQDPARSTNDTLSEGYIQPYINPSNGIQDNRLPDDDDDDENDEAIPFSRTAGRDTGDFHDLREKINNEKWQRVAKLIDEVSRFVFPFTYAIFLSVAFARPGI